MIVFLFSQSNQSMLIVLHHYTLTTITLFAPTKPTNTHNLSLYFSCLLFLFFLTQKPSHKPFFKQLKPSFRKTKQKHNLFSSLLLLFLSCIFNMDVGLDLLGGGGGGGISLGGSSNGSLTTEVVEQEYVGLSSEASSYSELDLGLGLSLGSCGNGGVKANNNNKPSSWGEYGRILTAKDFPSMGSSSSSSSDFKASINPSLTTKTPVSGTKRAADSIAQDRGSPNGAVSSQVVGWPPIRTYRINSLVNQTKNSSVEEDKMVVENSKNKEITKTKIDDRKNNDTLLNKDRLGKSLFVKVNMDGVPIGRKVDLNAHACYETLAQTLEDMFYRPSTTTTNFLSSSEEKEYGVEAKKVSKLLGGSSEFVLTYEDKDGDWMLVGDVPWGMFLNTVKRLRIMRTSDANGLAPRYDGNNDRQRNKPI